MYYQVTNFMTNQSNVYCRNCGKKLDSNSNYCEYCGTSVNVNFSKLSNESKKSMKKSYLYNSNIFSQAPFDYTNIDNVDNLYNPPTTLGLSYKKFNTDNIIHGSFNLYIKNFKNLIPIYLIFMILVYLSTNLIVYGVIHSFKLYNFNDTLHKQQTYQFLVLSITLILSILLMWIPNTINYAITDDFVKNNKVNMNSITKGLKKLPDVIFLFIIYFMIITGISTILYLLTGFNDISAIILFFIFLFSLPIFNLKLFLTMPNIILDNKNPIDGLKSSWKKTSGNLRSIYGAFVLFNIIIEMSFIVMGILTIIFNIISVKLSFPQLSIVLAIGMLILIFPFIPFLNISAFYLDKYDKGDLKYQFLYESVPKA